MNLVAADVSRLITPPRTDQSRLTSAATVPEFKARAGFRGILSPLLPREEREFFPASRVVGSECSRAGRAFTLIELMVVIAIMGIVMTIAIPTIYQQLHPESMRKAVSDVMEACSHARARAILDGATTDLVIRPAIRQFEVVAGGGIAPGQGSGLAPDAPGSEWHTAPRPVSQGGSGGGAFTVKLSDRILIEGMGINGEDYTEDEVGRVHFYPNGTSDEFSIVLLSDKGERRNITLEVVTALADTESDPNKFKYR